MQTALSQGCKGLKPLSARRSALHAPSFGTCSRRTSVQVFAKGKGKGKTALRQGSGIPGQQQMVRNEPPVPEVDPENAEIVVFLRVKKYKDMTTNVMMGPSPWIPLSILKGTQVMNFLVNVIKTEWGMKLYGRTLMWQVATSLYRERANTEKSVRKQYPPFANCASKDFEYGMKIRDKANPKDWTKTEDLIVLPAEEELGATGLEIIRAFFSTENLASMFKAPEGGSAPVQQQ